MRNRRRLEIIGGSAMLGAAVALVFDLTGLGKWVDGMTDALWWDVLPWALLLLFWAVLGSGVLRQRKRRRSGGPDEP